jgi:ATP-dependent DNA helicase RecG
LFFVRLLSEPRSEETGVTVVLPGGPADLGFVRFMIEQERAGRDLSLDDLLVLSTLQHEGEINLQQVTALVQKPPAQSLTQLERLIQVGWLEVRGRGEKRVYRLAGPASESLSREPVRPIRASKEELARREALILDHVRTHGRITRSEAASLCQVSSDQARHLLRRLVGQQRLVVRGRGRGVYYEAAPK